MSYYPKGHHHGDGVNDFDEYDCTPYGGGYDITLTYGRPLPPLGNICYPNTSSFSDDFAYDNPHYTSYTEPSAYGGEAVDNEYKSYTRPKPRPTPSYAAPPAAAYGGVEYHKPETNYGHGGSGYGSGSDHGSGYNRKPDYESSGSEYRSGYGHKPESDQPSSEYGSGYGRKSEYEKVGSECGSGHGHDGRSNSGRPSYETHEGEGYGRPAHERPNYGRTEEEDYHKPSYERRHHHHDDDDDDKGYGGKKYGNDNSDDDDNDEKKKHRNKHHQHHTHYND